MSRKLTAQQAREMARKTLGGGRPRKPTSCPKCRKDCPSYRQAQAYCMSR